MRSFHSRVSVFCHAAAEQQQPKKIYPISNSGNRRTKYRTKRRQRHRRRCEKKARKNTEWFILIWSLNHLTFTFFTSRKLTTFEKGEEKKSVGSRVHHSVVVKNNLNKTVEFLINFFKSHSSSPFFSALLLRHGRALYRVRELKEVETEMEKTNSSRGWNDSKSNLKSELHLR